MDRRSIGFLALLSMAWLAPAATRAEPPQPEIGRYRAHVATLASREFAGRRGNDSAKAAAYVGKHLVDLGLAPGFPGGSFVQEIPDAAGRGVIGNNVAAKIVGTDPNLRDEWIIIGAHFDHLGRREGTYYPGADDNATGVAMLLEAARCFARDENRPKRSVLFVGFDLEENGLIGSSHFVRNSPVPLGKIKLFVTADMIGRALGGVCDRFVFLFGAETLPGIKTVVDQAAKEKPVRLAPLGNDLLIVDRSDYGPFRRNSIPYLFFSTGENPNYHRTTDTSDTIDYETAIATTQIVTSVLRHAASAPQLPGWNGQTEPSMEEALAVRDVLQIMLQNREKMGIGAASQIVLRTTLSTLDGVATRGTITRNERVKLVRAAQFLMAAVL